MDLCNDDEVAPKVLSLLVVVHQAMRRIVAAYNYFLFLKVFLSICTESDMTKNTIAIYIQIKIGCGGGYEKQDDN